MCRSSKSVHIMSYRKSLLFGDSMSHCGFLGMFSYSNWFESQYEARHTHTNESRFIEYLRQDSHNDHTVRDRVEVNVA